MAIGIEMLCETLMFMQLLASMTGGRDSPSKARLSHVKRLFTDLSAYYGSESIVMFIEGGVDSEKEYPEKEYYEDESLNLALGPHAEFLKKQLPANWQIKTQDGKPDFWVGKQSTESMLPVAIRIRLTLKRAIIVGEMLRLPTGKDALSDLPEGFSIALLNQDAGLIFPLSVKNGAAATLISRRLSEAKLTSAQFEAGVRELKFPEGEFIIGYQKLYQSQLIIVSIVSKDMAYQAIGTLWWRSMILGGAVLMISLGLTLLIVFQLTKYLRQLSEATLKVSDGDFSVRMSTDRLPKDEFGSRE